VKEEKNNKGKLANLHINFESNIFQVLFAELLCLQGLAAL
jgi:hypothetical protein